MGYKIDKIAIHNFGGLANNPLASTQILSEDHINTAHHERWPDFPSELNHSYIGYNIIIWPKGSWKQYRYLGEETAGIKGHNSDTFHICLAGNFTKGVDKPTQEQVGTLISILKALLNNTYSSIGIQAKYDTIIDFNISRIYPHRLLSPLGYTECYGNALSDDWARSLVMPTASTMPDTTKKAALGIIDQIILLFAQLRRLFADPVQLGSVNDRDDVGVL